MSSTQTHLDNIVSISSKKLRDTRDVLSSVENWYKKNGEMIAFSDGRITDEEKTKLVNMHTQVGKEILELKDRLVVLQKEHDDASWEANFNRHVEACPVKLEAQ